MAPPKKQDPTVEPDKTIEQRATERHQERERERQSIERGDQPERRSDEEITARIRPPVQPATGNAETGSPAQFPDHVGDTTIDRGTPHASDLGPDGLPWDRSDTDAGKTHLRISSIRPRFARLGIEATTTPQVIPIDNLSPPVVAELVARSDDWFRVEKITAREASRLADVANVKPHDLTLENMSALVRQLDKVTAERDAARADLERMQRERMGDRPPLHGAPGSAPPLPVPGPGPGTRSVQERIEAQKAAPPAGARPAGDIADDKERNPLPPPAAK